MNTDNTSLLLGIDVGTTSISFQIVSAQSGKCVESFSIVHNAEDENKKDGSFAQNALLLSEKTLSSVDDLLKKYENITSIGVTGQMHGIICINSNNEIVSPLYTWQNEFGTKRTPDGLTVCEEIEKKCGIYIPTGYGITTYYALRYFGILPEETSLICTIPDYIAASLCRSRPVCHATNAASLGLFDIENNDFDVDALNKLGTPRSVLPEIAKDYEIAGYYSKNGRKIPVVSAIGDNQSSVLGSLADENSILVNVGTGSQICYISDKRNSEVGEVRPYFDGKYLISGAALCGGRAYSLIKDLVDSILYSFGWSAAESDIYYFLNRSAKCAENTDLAADTRFCGTRENPFEKGSFTNVCPGNLKIGDMAAAILKGIVEELFDMYQKMQIGEGKKIIVSGNAMRKNRILREFCSKRFAKKVLVPEQKEEAAFGAALYSGISAGIISRDKLGDIIKYLSDEEERR